MPIDYGTHNISTSGNIVASSGNFSALTVNGNPIGEGGAIVNNFGDNRLLTSTGTVGGINAEANLTFDGGILAINSASTAATYGGSLRIGPMSSGSLLSNGGLEFVNAASSNGWGWRIANLDAGAGSVPLVFQNRSNSTSWSEVLRITEGGNVGIGTSSPSTKLDVFGTAGGGATIRINDGTQDLRLYTSTGIGVVGTISNSSLGFHTNNTERMRIDSAGSVGIGTSSPSNRLHVQGGELYKTTTDFVFGTTGSLVTTYHGASTGNTYGAIGALSAGGGAWNNLVLQAGGGNVGIGTTSPTQKLHITGVLRIGGGGNQSTGEINLDDGVTQYTGNAFQIRKDSSSYWALKSVTAGNDLALFVDNTVARGLYIANTTGNVGIGTTSPATRLHVAGTSSTFNGLLLTTTAAGGGAYASIEIGTYYPTWTVASPASLRFIDDNNFSTHITFRTKTSGSASNSDVERFRITSAGNTEIRANAGNVSSAFVYNENGGELVHYDETQTAATLLDQSSNQTRLLELVNGSNLVLGLGSSNTTGSIVFVRAGYNEAMRIDSTGAAWMKTTRAWNDTVPTLSIGNDGDGRLQTRHIWGKLSSSAAAEHLWLQHGNTNNHVQIGATGGGNNLYVVGDIYANGYFGGALLLYGASGMRRGVHQITNWNQTTLPDVAFLSSENSVTNAPTTDYSYGIQYAFHRSGAAYRTQLVTSLYSDLDIWVRNSRDSDVWTAWKKLLHSGNYNTYALPLSGGTLTGPVEISTGAIANNYNEGLRLTAANNGWTGITFGSTGLSGAPTNGWFVARNPSNQFIISPADSSSTTGITLNSGGNALWRNNIILHAGNYNSYAPTLTGGGASGTWGINITGNASTATSATSATTATTATNWGTYGGVPAAGTSFANANTIGRSDINGYTYFGYINSSTGNSENPTVSQVIVTNGGDNFYRKASIAHLTSAVQSNASGSWGINITGNAATVTNGLTTTNYNSYAPTLTGGNASGTWGINITGNAATSSNGLRAWVIFDGTNPSTGTGVAVAIQGQRNVFNVVRNSTGNFTITFTSAINTTNYAVTTSATVGSTGFSTQTANAITVFSQTVAGGATNPGRMSVMIAST